MFGFFLFFTAFLYCLAFSAACCSQPAGRMIAGKLNQIGTPVTTFGITGGNWKCCDAGVTWNGRCWVATLVWSRSRYETGWDTDLYPDGVES